MSAPTRTRPGVVPDEQLPDPRARNLRPISAQQAEAEPEGERLTFAERRPAIVLSAVVEHRGRQITIQAHDMTVEQFCDLLDKRGFDPPPQTQEWQKLPDGTPICPKHKTPMKLREKQGDTWFSHRVKNEGGEELWCKGYRGKDSPGYEC